jgi:hypothetical protein
MTTPLGSIHPVSAILHYEVLAIINKYAVKTIVDLGGTGKAQEFTAAKVTNINRLDGADALNIKVPDCYFDASMSVATVEHVGEENLGKFFLEAFRVAQVVSTHWLPLAPGAAVADAIKNKFGHKHRAQLPDWPRVQKIVNKIKPSGATVQFVPGPTAREHLLLLACMRESMRSLEFYKCVMGCGNSLYGGILHVIMNRGKK